MTSAWVQLVWLVVDVRQIVVGFAVVAVVAVDRIVTRGAAALVVAEEDQAFYDVQIDLQAKYAPKF